MNEDIFLANTIDRKEWYRLQIGHYIKKIPEMQAPDGGFKIGVESFYRPGKNARLQEGILPLAWHMSRFGTENYRENIISGIKYLLDMQLDNGAYPEIEGESFAATTFITYAIGKTLEYAHTFLPENIKKEIALSMRKSIAYLTRHTDVPYTNQLASALLALKQAKKTFPIQDQELDARLAKILDKRDTSGLFEEGEGLDLGYSTLTYSLLSAFDPSQNFYKGFIKTLEDFIFPDGTHILPMSRTCGFIILNALEAASRFHENAGKLAAAHIRAHETGLCDATHLISKRHILTTLYRLCEAYDNCDPGRQIQEMPNKASGKINSLYLKTCRKEKTTGLFYFGKSFLGYSFYLGPKRILFGRLKNAVLKEKKDIFTVTKREGRFCLPLRVFIMGDFSLTIRNFSREPIFSIGRIIPGARPDGILWQSNQNIFYKNDFFSNQLPMFKKCSYNFRKD